MCKKWSLGWFGFVVCKISSGFKKSRTFFIKKFESYQRRNVSMLTIRILMIIQIKIVNRNENLKLKKQELVFRKRLIKSGL